MAKALSLDLRPILDRLEMWLISFGSAIQAQASAAVRSDASLMSLKSCPDVAMNSRMTSHG